MKIKELMSLNLFKTGKLLTESIGLENEIESAMVLEALDIENWSRSQQLILTSFYAFKDLPIIELRPFFEKMQKMGVSGLVVKMDRLITIIPDWLIDLCFEFQIPLIKIEQEVSYEKIMLTIYEPLLNQREHLLRTYYEVRQHFTKMERNSHSFQQIMATFYQLIQLPCSLTIPSLNIAISYGKSFDDYRVIEKSYVTLTEFTKNNYQQHRLVSANQEKSCLMIVAELTTTYIKHGTLKVYLEDGNLDESHMMILENIIDVLYEHSQTEYLIKKERYTRLNNLADAILQNTPTNMDELNSLLDEADMNRYKYYQGLAFAENNEAVKHLHSELLNKLSRLKARTIFFEHYNYTVILYNFQNPKEKLLKEDIIATLKSELLLHPDLLISLSQVKKKTALKEILLECLDSIRFNQLMPIDSIVSIDDLGIFRYFLRENQAEQLEQLIPPQLKQLWESHEELFETLFAFFQCGRNYKKTAESLFLHSKTIRYRLNKIQELLLVDLSNPLQLVNYEIATYLLKTQRRDLDA